MQYTQTEQNRMPWPLVVGLLIALSVPIGLILGIAIDEPATIAFMERIFGD